MCIVEFQNGQERLFSSIAFRRIGRQRILARQNASCSTHIKLNICLSVDTLLVIMAIPVQPAMNLFKELRDKIFASPSGAIGSNLGYINKN